MDKWELFYRVKNRRILAGVFASRAEAIAERDAVHAAQARRNLMPTMFQIRRVPAQVAA